MLFVYKGVDQGGSQRQGTIEAVNTDIAINSLQRRGLTISDIQEAGAKKGMLNTSIKMFERVSNKEIVILSQQISTLFEAQVSALRVFQLLGSEVENPKLHRKLLDIAKNIQGGTSISGALEKHPDVFTPFYVSMVKAGEETGKLSETFIFLAQYLDRTYEVTSKARNALIYPAFVIFTFFAVMALMLTVVIPKISTILVESGSEIPLYTKVVIGVSNFLVGYGPFILVAMAIAVFALIRYRLTPNGKKGLDRIKISFPYLGNLYRKLYLSRISDNLNTMLSSGIPMIKALELTKDVVDNRIYQTAIQKATEDVKGGSPLSDALGRYPEIMPSILIQMIRVGEETGNLGDILATLAKFYRREVETAVDTLVDLIEPIMIIMLGLGVGTLLASVLIPIYNISSSF